MNEYLAEIATILERVRTRGGAGGRAAPAARVAIHVLRLLRGPDMMGPESDEVKQATTCWVRRLAFGHIGALFGVVNDDEPQRAETARWRRVVRDWRRGQGTTVDLGRAVESELNGLAGTAGPLPAHFVRSFALLLKDLHEAGYFDTR